MPQILFVVEVPPMKGISTSSHYPPEWTEFENSVNTILKPVKTCVRLQLNAWLLPAENILPVLTSMTAAANEHGLSYSSLLIPDGAITLAPNVKQKS